MGLFRKLTSISTLGVVDLRSDKERIARSTRRGSKEAKKQTAIMKQMLREQRKANRDHDQ